MNTLTTPTLTSAQLREAADVQDQIAQLQNRLTTILSGKTVTATTKGTASTKGKGTRQFSAEVRAKIAAGQKARWARVNAAKANGTATTTAPATPATPTAPTSSGDIPEGAEAVKMVSPASRS